MYVSISVSSVPTLLSCHIKEEVRSSYKLAKDVNFHKRRFNNVKTDIADPEYIFICIFYGVGRSGNYKRNHQAYILNTSSEEQNT